MNLHDFIKVLTPVQIKNWKKLITLIRNSEYDYSHDNFVSDSDDDNARCALSVAVIDGMFDHDGYNSQYDNFTSNYADEIEETFGEDACNVVFDGDSDFNDYLVEHHEGSWKLDGKTAADALAKFLGFNVGNIKHVTVHWKGNRHDHFESVEALESYFKLNPDRANSYRKITQTNLVPRTVYDEVVETITL